jgi:hypothetical protein
MNKRLGLWIEIASWAMVIGGLLVAIWIMRVT